MKYALLFLATLPAFSQFMGTRPPDMPGLFHPVVGAGAEYRVSTQREPNANFAFVIVGQEDGGYWMEIRTNRNGQAVVMKNLMSGDPPQPKRTIVQANGRVMELPAGMMGMAMTGRASGGAGAGNGIGAKVGSESVTVPAGTFECDHYTSTSNGKQSDVWISTKVAPWGVVKATGSYGEIELEKVLEHETSQIKGEPTKINIPGR